MFRIHDKINVCKYILDVKINVSDDNNINTKNDYTNSMDTDEI